MYIILVYDIEEHRVNRVMKICRKYLSHVQNSVFEGEISTVNYKKLNIELKKTIDKETDSIIIYRLANTKYTERVEIGKCKDISNFI